MQMSITDVDDGAEQASHPPARVQDASSDITEIRRVIVRWQGDTKDDDADAV